MKALPITGRQHNSLDSDAGAYVLALSPEASYLAVLVRDAVTV